MADRLSYTCLWWCPYCVLSKLGDVRAQLIELSELLLYFD